MFDELVPFAEQFSEGQVFQLDEARVGPAITTEFGVSAPVMLKIAGKWFSVFGQGLTNQVERMEPGDLPAEVKIIRRNTKGGQQVKLLVPKDAPDTSDDVPF